MNRSVRLQQALSLLNYRRVGLVIVPVLGLALLVYGILSVLPKTIDVSFASKTCTSEMTLFPALYTSRGSAGYEVEYERVSTVGPIEILSSEVCFRPTEAPSPGSVHIATSPWGGPLVLQAYNLHVPSPPKVNAAALNEPIPTTKSVEMELDKPDTLHTYSMAVGTQSLMCGSGEQRISCDLHELNLRQGKTYEYSISREFSDESTEVVTGSLTTLRAVSVKSASVRQEQVIYSKPRSFTVLFDKPVRSVSAQLQTDGKDHPTTVSVDGAEAVISTEKHLSRESLYRLAITSVEAADGSSLSKPYGVTFYVSGGPKVASISIGPNRVAANERVLLTFDQALSSSQPASTYVSVTGGGGSVSKINDTQVAVQLSGLGRCEPFSISVLGGIKSAYNIENSLGWKYDTRTTCAVATVFGRSVQGRALIAYSFGDSGPVTLYTGAIHGNEVSSKYLMDAWIAELENNPEKIGNRRVVVIPSINPDGVSAGTRNNARNVNLSRNFPTDNWVSDINDTNGPLKGGGGKEPLSEPEAKALASYTQSLNPRLLLSFHAIGGFVVGDPGGYSAGKAAQYASLAGLGDVTGQVGTFDYDITGAYEDWTYRNVGIPSMVIELSSYSYASIGKHRAALWEMLKQ